jgi:hypothetical protein
MVGFLPRFVDRVTSASVLRRHYSRPEPACIIAVSEIAEKLRSREISLRHFSQIPEISSEAEGSSRA